MEVAMHVRLHAGIDDFRSVALDIYRRDPIEATVELMVLCGRLVDVNPAPSLVTVWEGGVAVGAAFQTLRSPLLAGGLPESTIDHVVAELGSARPDLNGIHGPRRVATKFGEAWRVATGAVGTESAQERLHRLDGLRSPAAVAGRVRRAGDADEELIGSWLNRFRAEALGVVVAPGARHVRTAKEWPDEFILWTVDGEPVSMAGIRLPIAGVSRLGPVYTPVDHRGHGYAAAATAAAAGWALDAGARDVVLFTDLTKPAVNAVYQRIGFVPVGDFMRIDFSGPHTRGPR
jgi:GNAT superfamily N-acetyltransferase